MIDLTLLLILCGLVRAGSPPLQPTPFDLNFLKAQWKERIGMIGKSGRLPIIDIESSYEPLELDVRDFSKQMDEQGIAIIAFSPDIRKRDYLEHDAIWTDHPRTLIRMDPTRYIPVTPAGGFVPWSKEPMRFVKETIAHVRSEGYPLMGEFGFRHYPSYRQAQKKQLFHDITVPINGEAAHLLFDFAQKSGVPFQIHYEIEDDLLPPLEDMLRQYPKVKVLWCHLAQIRYSSRSKKYGPDYVRKLIETYPGIHFDLAVSAHESVYPLSGEHHARLWDQETKRLAPRWRQLIIDYPWRFHAALDLDWDVMGLFSKKVARQREILEELPPGIRDIVAYKATWKLLFNESL